MAEMTIGCAVLLNLPTPARRVEAVEAIRKYLREQSVRRGEEIELSPDGPLSQPSLTWLKRMRATLVDYEVSQASFDELMQAYKAYRDSLPEDEAQELESRVCEFESTKNWILRQTR